MTTTKHLDMAGKKVHGNARAKWYIHYAPADGSMREWTGEATDRAGAMAAFMRAVTEWVSIYQCAEFGQ